MFEYSILFGLIWLLKLSKISKRMQNYILQHHSDLLFFKYLCVMLNKIFLKCAENAYIIHYL